MCTSLSLLVCFQTLNMSSTVAMPVSTQASRGGKPGLAKDISKDLYTSLACSLILDDCSILASVAAESADMVSFRSPKEEHRERIKDARANIDSHIHSPSISRIRRQRRHSTLPVHPTTTTGTIHPSTHYSSTSIPISSRYVGCIPQS
jgi:hypothetical protein